MGHFPQKFSESPSSETTGRIEKKINGEQKWYGHPLSSCKVWWRSAAARRREKQNLGVFLFVCHALDIEQRFSHSNSNIVAIVDQF